MNESYVELLVKCKKSAAAAVGSIILAVLGAIFFFFVILTGNIFAFLIAVFFFGSAYFLRYSANVEYEYLYLDKEFTVDKIYNQTGRKKVAVYDMTQLEVLAPAGSHHLDEFKSRTEIKKRDFTSNYPDSNPYEMIVREDGKLKCAVIEVNDMLLKQIERIAPRKVFKD